MREIRWGKRNGVELKLIQKLLITTAALENGSGVSVFYQWGTGMMWSLVLAGAWFCTAPGWHCLFHCNSCILLLAKVRRGLVSCMWQWVFCGGLWLFNEKDFVWTNVSWWDSIHWFREAVSAAWIKILTEHKQTFSGISGPLECYQGFTQGWEQTVPVPRGAGVEVAAPRFALWWHCLPCNAYAGSVSSQEHGESREDPIPSHVLGGHVAGEWKCPGHLSLHTWGSSSRMNMSLVGRRQIQVGASPTPWLLVIYSDIK